MTSLSCKTVDGYSSRLVTTRHIYIYIYIYFCQELIHRRFWKMSIVIFSCFVVLFVTDAGERARWWGSMRSEWRLKRAPEIRMNPLSSSTTHEGRQTLYFTQLNPKRPRKLTVASVFWTQSSCFKLKYKVYVCFCLKMFEFTWVFHDRIRNCGLFILNSEQTNRGKNKNV